MARARALQERQRGRVYDGSRRRTGSRTRRMRVSVVRRQDVKWWVTHRFIHIHGRLHRQAPYRAQIVSKMAARLGEGGQARHNPRASAAAPRGHPTSAAIDLAARSSFPVLYRTIGVAIVSDAEFDSAQVLPKPDPGSICARVTGSGVSVLVSHSAPPRTDIEPPNGEKESCEGGAWGRQRGSRVNVPRLDIFRAKSGERIRIIRL
ncbi:hypothetical protein B0H14DRAFT_2944161 [Mycena olivaceomarginata]|nr:hypothetical protein B0H14DRAFT_2944161 [Mycena olivaceomarginata]